MSAILNSLNAHNFLMDLRLTWTDCDEAEDYFVPNVLSPRDLVFRPDIMDETVKIIITSSFSTDFDDTCIKIHGFIELFLIKHTYY